jgi:hypothetical protein
MLLYVPRIHDPRPGHSLMIAMLLADDQESYVIPLLNRASTLEVRGGLFIEGAEIHPRGRALKNIKADTYPQRCFCRPAPRPAPPDAKAARLRRSGAAAQRHSGTAAQRNDRQGAAALAIAPWQFQPRWKCVTRCRTCSRR